MSINFVEMFLLFRFFLLYFLMSNGILLYSSSKLLFCNPRYIKTFLRTKKLLKKMNNVIGLRRINLFAFVYLFIILKNLICFFKTITMILEIICVLMIGFFIGIAAAFGGMVSGDILTSLLILGFNVSLKQSINLAYILQSGGGLGTTLASFPRKNSLGRRLIDYELMMRTMPMLMSGVIFGAMIKNSINQLVLAVCFIILIIYLFFLAKEKLRQVRQKEQLQLKRTLSQHLIQQRNTIQNYNPLLRQILQKQDQLFPADKIKTIGLIYLYTIIILFVKGGNNYESIIGLQPCSLSTWAVLCVHVVISIMFTESIADKKIELDDQKQRLGYIFRQNEKFNKNKFYMGMLADFMAGCATAALSVGAGMILVPMWYSAGIERNTATATSGPLVFMAVSLYFMINFLLGRYHSFNQILIYFGGSCLWVYIFRHIIIYLIEKYKLKTIVFYLVKAMMVAALLITICTKYRLIDKISQRFFMFDRIC